VRDHWRQPYLQALDVPAAHSDAAGRQSGDDAASLLPTAGVVDDERLFAKLDDHRDRRVRDHIEVDGLRGPIAKSGHADPREAAR
jgi:hypothetical protein